MYYNDEIHNSYHVCVVHTLDNQWSTWIQSPGPIIINIPDSRGNVACVVSENGCGPKSSESAFSTPDKLSISLPVCSLLSKPHPIEGQRVAE